MSYLIYLIHNTTSKRKLKYFKTGGRGNRFEGLLVAVLESEAQVGVGLIYCNNTPLNLILVLDQKQKKPNTY